jgi:predicted PurR-regulated permease PerM
LPSLSGLMTLAVGVVVVAALYLGREVIIPIALAVLLSFVLAPVVNGLRRLRLGRAPAVIVAVILALGVILAIGAVIGTQLAQLATDLPRYEATVAEKIGTVRRATIDRVSELLRGVHRELRGTETPAQAPARRGAAPPKRGAEAPPAAPQAEPSPLELMHRVLAPVLGPIETTGIVLVVTVFILMQRQDLRDRLIRLFGASDLHRTTAAMDDAARRLSKYFLTQLALNTLFGVIIGLGLWLIGVPGPVLWGIVAMLMRFVPYVGAFIAGVIPVVLAAAVDPGWSMMLWTAALFLVAEPVMGQVVEPLVYGHSTGLSPFAVVVAALFWTWLWGAIGLILSTPLTLCLVVLGRHVERLEFLDVLFGDRPALTPVENFYQRMLADDPDEALDQAELLLKERSLSSYYDEVALKGLRLAAEDASRGVLRPQQLERIKDAIRDLVRDLAEHADADPAKPADTAGSAGERAPANAASSDETPPDRSHLPPAWRGEAPVLCVAGRGSLDEAAADMLAQLLSKHGLGARVLPHRAVSRANILGLEFAGVAMVCISYLEISGSPAHLRYLVRRLRQRLPGVPILVGLWPAEDAILTNETLRARVGADYYVASLRQAVQACLEAVRAAETEFAAREAPVPGLPPSETAAS